MDRRKRTRRQIERRKELGEQEFLVERSLAPSLATTTIRHFLPPLPPSTTRVELSPAIHNKIRLRRSEEYRRQKHRSGRAHCIGTGVRHLDEGLPPLGFGGGRGERPPVSQRIYAVTPRKKRGWGRRRVGDDPLEVSYSCILLFVTLLFMEVKKKKKGKRDGEKGKRDGGKGRKGESEEGERA